MGATVASHDRRVVLLVILTAVVLLATCPGALAIDVHEVQYASQADIKIFEVKYESQADLCVYVENYASTAGDNEELWHYVDYAGQADTKIYKVKYQSRADLAVFLVKYRSRAGWKRASSFQGKLRRSPR
ncbi:MAG: hypothetical protein HYX75_24230 [Acidobacteria bacterium]|nr:hypothetical protein [Acidobacteriota bacterium]